MTPIVSQGLRITRGGGDEKRGRRGARRDKSLAVKAPIRTELPSCPQLGKRGFRSQYKRTTRSGGKGVLKPKKNASV